MAGKITGSYTLMVKLGDIFRWKGHLTEVLYTNEGNRSIGFVTKDTGECPHCGHAVDENWDVIEDSPNFKEGAKPVKTIEL